MESDREQFDATERLTFGGESDASQAFARAAPATNVSHYLVGSLLGSGGMADVYRAFDPLLHRTVALKFLRELDDEHVARFLREARTQAQVGHENICDVYEAGVSNGRPFIAMRWIDGQTLAEAAPQMSIEEKVAVMAGIAEAVHAAHRTGLVHRDLKPNNIMVESTPDAGWHPYVLDFGLARDPTMDTMTMAGAVMGTPPFMAPEQARGDRAAVDRRTDVYSLGATLFDILAGRPPFVSESSMGVIMQVVSAEAPSLRSIDPSIPVDLDTIVLKCLEKDPRRRYDSARALADDLRRYLDGDAIEARPTTYLYRWTSRAQKHPTIAALLGVAMLAVLISLGWAVVTSMRSGERQRAAQRFGQEIERIEAVARYASMLPLHDVQRERRWIRERIARIEKERTTLGTTASGPAEYAIGRGYLALRDWENSRRHLEAAWNHDYRAPEVAYALGRVTGAQYQEELEEADRLANREMRAVRRRQIDAKYRDAALGWLRRSAGSGSESPAYAEGLLALYEKRYDAALERAQVAFREVPWLHEAKKLEGDIWIARGNEQFNDGRADDAVASYRKAGDAFRAASAIAASDESALLGEAEQWFRLMQIAINRGDDPTDLLQKGLAASQRAAMTNANVGTSLQQQGTLLLRFGEWQLSQGTSPLETLDRAVTTARRATALDAKSAAAHRIIGAALFSKARYAATHDQDPLPLFDESIRSLRRAVALDPRGAYTLAALANSLRRKGEFLGGAGGNPQALLNESIVYYDRSTAVDPQWANSWNDRGLAFMTRGEWEMEHGVDPMPSFADSAKSLERAVSLNPGLSVSILNLGSVHLDRGNHLLRTGADPRTALQQATDTYASALKLNPKLAYAHSNSGLAALLAAQYVLDRDEDPRAWIERGLASYERALEIHPDHANSYAYSGLLLLVAGQHAARAGDDPTPLLAQAREKLHRAAAINSAGEYLQSAAAVEAEAARYALAQGKSASASLSAAEQLLQRAMALNAEDADTFYTSADVQRLRGNDDAALTAIERSIAIDGEKSESHALRGELLLKRAKATNNRESAWSAVQEFDRAMQLKPTSRTRLGALRAEALRVSGR